MTATLGSGLYTGRMYEFGVFAQDDWRVGLQSDGQPGDALRFLLQLLAMGKTAHPTPGLYNPNFLSMDGLFTVGPFRPRSSPYENDAKNFGPRVGFSYNPDGKGKTAIRGGFGVMFSNVVPEDFWNLVSSAQNVPYRITFTPADISAFGIKFPDFNDNLFKYAQQLVKTSSVVYVSGNL